MNGVYTATGRERKPAPVFFRRRSESHSCANGGIDGFPLPHHRYRRRSSSKPSMEGHFKSNFRFGNPTAHLNANQGQLYKRDENYCNYIRTVKSFALRRDALETNKKD